MTVWLMIQTVIFFITMSRKLLFLLLSQTTILLQAQSIDSEFGIEGTQFFKTNSYNKIKGFERFEDHFYILSQSLIQETSSVNADIIIIRTDTLGTIDSTFGSQGYLTLDFPKRTKSYPESFIIESNRILIAGNSITDSNTYQGSILSLTHDGDVIENQHFQIGQGNNKEIKLIKLSRGYCLIGRATFTIYEETNDFPFTLALDDNLNIDGNFNNGNALVFDFERDHFNASNNTKIAHTEGGRTVSVIPIGDTAILVSGYYFFGSEEKKGFHLQLDLTGSNSSDFNNSEVQAIDFFADFGHEISKTISIPDGYLSVIESKTYVDRDFYFTSSNKQGSEYVNYEVDFSGTDDQIEDICNYNHYTILMGGSFDETNQGNISYITGRIYDLLSLSIHRQDQLTNSQQFQFKIDTNYAISPSKIFTSNQSAYVCGSITTDTPNVRNVFITKIDLQALDKELDVTEPLLNSQVSPNPCSSILSIPEVYSAWTIYDQWGETLFSGQDCSFDVSFLEPGMYHIRSGKYYSSFLKE